LGVIVAVGVTVTVADTVRVYVKDKDAVGTTLIDVEARLVKHLLVVNALKEAAGTKSMAVATIRSVDVRSFILIYAISSGRLKILEIRMRRTGSDLYCRTA